MPLPAKKFFLQTMGCQMNVLDSEVVSSILRRAGFESTQDVRAAEVVLFNTCSVRDHAENKVHSHVGQACQRKAAGKKIVIGVLGCMAQRMGEELLRRHPLLDIVCGPGQLGQLPDLIAQVGAGPQIALNPDRRGAKREEFLQAADVDCLRDPGQTHLSGQAFVRIMHGCDKFCTYCVVPYVRGPEVSRPPATILEEVRRLADAGVTQVTLLGQTVNSYRFDDAGRRVGLADLLALVSDVPALRRVRFVTSYPTDFDDSILHAMASLPKVCRYMHVPAQSGSDRILKAMNRHYTRAQYDALIDRARAIVPGIAIAGDFIVGFPGETEDDFAASADLIRRSRYRNSYIFKYSPRPGTTAERTLADDVSEADKRRRNNELLAVQEEVSLAENAAFVSQAVEVLVEGKSPRSQRQPKPAPDGMTQMVGRTGTDYIVVFDGPESLAGQYVSVKVTSFSALTLIGERIG